MLCCDVGCGVNTGSTRILVTHQRQYLPKCDRIAVLRNGQLVACGTYQEVSAMQLPELVGGAVTISLDVPAQQQQQQDQVQPQLQTQTQLQHLSSLDLGAHDERTVAGVPADAQKEAAAAYGNSSSADDAVEHSSDSSGDLDPQFGRVLSRVRTMAPDVNKRPADSGRLPLSSSGSVLAATSSGKLGWWVNSRNSFARAASRVRSWGSGVFTQRPQQPADDELELEESGCGSYTRPSGLWARTKLHAYLAVAGLFTPPAYLPGGTLYRPPPSGSGAELPAAPIGFKSPSRKGLALLGPVRSLMPQPSLRFSSSGRWADPAHEAAGSGKHGLRKDPAAVGGGASITAAAGGKAGGASAAAVSGQLVAAETREIGSVSWSVYGEYCKQMGLLTTLLLVAALFAGQGFALAAEWWLALWASAPRSEQSKAK